MPKLKSHRGAAKRFKKTASGKFKRSSAFKRHILSSQDHQAQARAARHDARLRGRPEGPRADAALQIRNRHARVRRARSSQRHASSETWNRPAGQAPPLAGPGEGLLPDQEQAVPRRASRRSTSREGTPTSAASCASATSAGCGSSGSTPRRASTGLTYRELIHGLKAAGVTLDRKMLADLAATQPEAFAAVAAKVEGAAPAATA